MTKSAVPDDAPNALATASKGRNASRQIDRGPRLAAGLATVTALATPVVVVVAALVRPEVALLTIPLLPLGVMPLASLLTLRSIPGESSKACETEAHLMIRGRSVQLPPASQELALGGPKRRLEAFLMALFGALLLAILPLALGPNESKGREGIISKETSEFLVWLGALFAGTTAACLALGRESELLAERYRRPALASSEEGIELLGDGKPDVVLPALRPITPSALLVSVGLGGLGIGVVWSGFPGVLLLLVTGTLVSALASYRARSDARGHLKADGAATLGVAAVAAGPTLLVLEVLERVALSLDAGWLALGYRAIAVAFVVALALGATLAVPGPEPQRQEALPTPTPQLDDGAEAPRCSFCGDPLDPLDATACATCLTLHHHDCWLEADACTVFACGGQEGLSTVPGAEGEMDSALVRRLDLGAVPAATQAPPGGWPVRLVAGVLGLGVLGYWSPGEPGGILLFGLFALVIALGVMDGRAIDRRRRTVSNWWGMTVPLGPSIVLGETTLAFEKVACVEYAYVEKKGSRGSVTRSYPVTVRAQGKGERSIEYAEAGSWTAARALAEELARTLGVGVVRPKSTFTSKRAAGILDRPLAGRTLDEPEPSRRPKDVTREQVDEVQILALPAVESRGRTNLVVSLAGFMAMVIVWLTLLGHYFAAFFLAITSTVLAALYFVGVFGLAPELSLDLVWNFLLPTETIAIGEGYVTRVRSRGPFFWRDRISLKHLEEVDLVAGRLLAFSDHRALEFAALRPQTDKRWLAWAIRRAVTRPRKLPERTG